METLEHYTDSYGEKLSSQLAATLLKVERLPRRGPLNNATL